MAEDKESKPASTGTPAWAEPTLIAGRAFCEWLSRPRVRLAVTGVALLAIGGLELLSSVWTLPLVLVGAVMVVTAWIGHRLEGRFAIEWGKTGTELAFRARIGAPQDGRRGSPHDGRPGVPPNPVTALDGVADPPDAEVIEGDAHTVEIDVAELKALIAAAERSQTVTPPEPADEAIRILRVPGAEDPEAGG
jgi:hypothetical protein